ncbi:hypothetical protein BH23BAC1_BH23BAC1_09230 [soil metagenome]|jgi:hypothetical protein
MKILLYLLIVIFPVLDSTESFLPKNEYGAIYFEEEVKSENLGKDELFLNGVKYISKIQKVSRKKPELNANLPAGIIVNKGSFYVYTQGLITPQIHGEITYNVRLEVNDDSYKYTITDFVFIYYQRNRYGRYAPVKGKYKPLEEDNFAGSQKTWINHKKTTKDIIEKQIEQLKAAMAEPPADANGGSEFSLEKNKN